MTHDIHDLRFLTVEDVPLRQETAIPQKSTTSQRLHVDRVKKQRGALAGVPPSCLNVLHWRMMQALNHEPINGPCCSNPVESVLAW